MQEPVIVTLLFRKGKAKKRISVIYLALHAQPLKNMLQKPDLITGVVVLYPLTYAAHLSISACNASQSGEDLISPSFYKRPSAFSFPQLSRCDRGDYALAIVRDHEGCPSSRECVGKQLYHLYCISPSVKREKCNI